MRPVPTGDFAGGGQRVTPVGWRRLNRLRSPEGTTERTYSRDRRRCELHEQLVEKNSSANTATPPAQLTTEPLSDRHPLQLPIIAVIASRHITTARLCKCAWEQECRNAID